jgi:outer membrane receptor protein involved in Fe transport
MMRRAIRQVLAGVGLALMFGAAWSDGPSTREVALNINATSLARALIQFTEQTGLQLVFPAEGKARELSAQPLVGTYTPQAALEKLLANSGLGYEYLDSQTVAIRVVKAGDKRSSSGSAADQMRLAAVVAQESAAQDSETEGAQVVVEGQRERPAPFSTANLDLTRTEDDVLPFTVLTAKDIELSGAVDLREFLASRLPQNFTDNNEALLDGNATSPLNDPIDLRGWGATETVLLLNGRRMGTENQDVFGDTTGRNLASLRSIPLGSIERIEILTSAGSAIYGASATGGVINIITRQDFSGGQLSVNYETPTDVLRARRAVSFSYGQPLKWGFGLRASAGYNDTEPMLVRDRSDVTIERYRRLALERLPSRLFAPVGGNPLFTNTTPLLGATPNIRAVSSTATGNLFADLAGAQASNFTTVPDGYTGGDLADFQPGIYNVELADAAGSAYGLNSYTASSTENMFFSLGLDRRFGEDWNWSVDYRFSQNRSQGAADAGLGFSGASALANRPRVPGSAPTNPFGQTVLVSLIDPNLNRPELVNRPRNSTWEVSSTLRGQVGSWRGYIDASVSENNSRSESYNFFEPLGGWTAAFNSGAYNPFVDTRVAAPAAPEFYEQYLARELGTANETRNYRAALKGSGPAFQLPAGAIQLTGGLEWSRSERNRADVYIRYRDSVTGELAVPVGGIPFTDTLILGLSGYPGARLSKLNSYAGYAEAVAPLISSAQEVPLVNALELFGSGRADRMNYRGNSGLSGEGMLATYETTSTLSAFGLRYEILKGVALRFSRSSGVKPPGLAVITPGTPPTRAITVQDPLRGEDRELSETMYITGGNPDVKPESTVSTNIGLILTPQWAPGLRLSLDYLESVRDDAIFSLGAQEAVSLEQEIPGLVQRGAPDGDASGVGPIIFIDQRYINLRQVSSRSLDINLEQHIADMSGGRLLLTVAATKNMSFKVQASNTGPAEEQVRNPVSSLSRQIAWNGNAQLRWEGPQWSFGWSARYFDYLLVGTAGITGANNLQLQGSDRAPRKISHDLNINYRAPALGDATGLGSLFVGTAFTLGIKNVFDREPRFWAASTQQGIAPYEGSTLAGRTVWIQMRKGFGN